METNGILLMQRYIEEQCGIKIDEDKTYLIESRLSGLVVEYGFTNFIEFYNMVKNQGNKEITEKVIDAITTNETSWFRDKSPWNILEEVILPSYIEEIRSGRRSKVRVWSAACSTGQEPYSIAMCIDNYLANSGINDISPTCFEIIATDISKTALNIAQNGKYDRISIFRGMNSPYKEIYFKNQGRVWSLDERIRKRVYFQKFNLQGNFNTLGMFDIVFCRYVMIYFSSSLQNEVLKKIASVLNSEGVLFLGSSELFTNYKRNFESIQYKNGVYYRLKG